MKRRELFRVLAGIVAIAGVPRAWGQNSRDKKRLASSDENSNRLPGASLNHILIFVPDVAEAKKFYAEKFGFREVFSFEQAGRKPGFTYLQISQNTFLELQLASSDHPPGLGHIGLAVASADEAVRTLRERGATPRVPHTSEQTHARISGVEGTPGVTFELLEFPPDSLVRKAMNAWKARPGTD